MEKQKLIPIRDLLLKTFVVGLILAIILFVMTFKFWDVWSTFVTSKFGVEKSLLGELVVNSFLYTRFYLLFVILAPAIGLHLAIKCPKNK